MKNAERGIISSYDMKKPLNKSVYILMCIVVAVMCLSMLYPIATALFNGLKANVEVNTFPPHFLPQEWHFDNYKKGWHFIDLTLYLRNTLLIFVGNMVVTVVVIGFAAFSLSRLDWPYRKAVYYFFLATLFIPPTTYIIPNFINLRDLHLMNTFWAFWLPAGANAFNILLLKSFMDGINKELFEAARMDGASELRCFLRMAVPLSLPVFSTLLIFAFTATWNDWYWPSLVLSAKEKYPISSLVYYDIVTATMLTWNVKFSVLTTIMIPPLIFFIIFQKNIMHGLNLSGVKG